MAALNLPIGANVLIGIAGVSHPGDWWFATILWTDGEEVLVRQGGIAGATPHNQLHEATMVRAVGEFPFLREFRDASAKAVAEQQAVVRRLEAELGEARGAVWLKLDEIGASRLGIETYEARGQRRRKAARKRIGIEEAA